MLVKGCSPCFISLLGHLGVSQAGYGARDARCPWCAAQFRSKGRHRGSPSCHSWIPIAARLHRCPKNGMRLGPAPAGDGPPASSTWLGQRDMSPVGTSVVAFHLACAALPGEHRARVPSRRTSHPGCQDKAYGCFLCPSAPPPAALSELLPGRGGWGQAERTTPGRSGCTDSVLGEPARARSLAHLPALVVRCPSAASEPSLLSATWVCPALLLGACLCKDSGSSFPILLTGRRDHPPYRGKAGVNAVMFLHFLSPRVHVAVSSARTNSLFRSRMRLQAPGLHRVHGNPPQFMLGGLHE